MNTNKNDLDRTSFFQRNWCVNVNWSSNQDCKQSDIVEVIAVLFGIEFSYWDYGGIYPKLCQFGRQLTDRQLGYNIRPFKSIPSQLTDS